MVVVPTIYFSHYHCGRGFVLNQKNLDWLKKIFVSHRIYRPKFMQIDNVQQDHFQSFELFQVISILKKYSKNLKPCVRYIFMGRPTTY